MLATHHGDRTAFVALAVPGVGALAVLAYLRRQVPRPADYDPSVRSIQARLVSLRGVSRRYWQYPAFSAAALAALASGWLYDRAGLPGVARPAWSAGGGDRRAGT